MSSFRDRLVLCLLACLALAACQPQTNVSATGNVPVQYQHVWVTLRQVAFNTSATAGPEDGSWSQFTLPSAQTVDLASFTNGALAQFASSLKVSEGTYKQMRITLADAGASVASSAQAAGATFNNEVDYTDASGTLHRLPLQVPNAAQGVAFPVNLTVVSAQQAGIAALACASMSSNGSLGNAGAFIGGGFTSSSNCAFGGQTKADCVKGQFFDSLLGSCITVGGTSQFGMTSGFGTGTFGSTSAINCPPGSTYDPALGSCTTAPNAGLTSCAAGTTFDSATGRCVASNNTNFASTCSATQTYNPTTGTCSSSLSAATSSLAIAFDASRDVVPYLIGGEPGFLLIPHGAAYNLPQAGSIAGTVSVAGLPANTGGIEVTAETLSADGSRHVIVASAPLSSTGNFVLYPLPATTTAASYTSSTSCPSGETYNSASGTCVTTGSSTEQYDLVIHGPGITTVIITGVPVTSGSSASTNSISFGITLAPANGSFPVQLASGSTVSPAGAYVGFYQTIPSSGEVPYLIEAYPVDPFTGAFDSAQYLSAADLQYGAYVSGGTVALTTAVPAEGGGTYHVAASAPLYGDGPLSTTVAAPTSATAAAIPFSVAAIPLPSGTSAASISGTVSVAAQGKYDRGELLLTQNGALIAVAPLDPYLAAGQSSATLFDSVPGSSGGGVSKSNQYFAEAWVWNSSNPAGTLSRQPVSSVIDLSSGNASGVTITIE